MKTNLTFFFLVFILNLNLIAQNSRTRKADKFFKRLEFVNAAKEYEKIIQDGGGNTYIFEQLAESYYNIFKTEKAEKYYAKALRESKSSEMIFKYAQMLKANGKYEKSNQEMLKFARLRPNDGRAIEFIENPNYLSQILERDNRFSLKMLPFNSKFSDFGGTLLDNKLYITSARNTSRKNYGWNQEPFLDIYELEIDNKGNYKEPVLLKGKANTKYHEGLVSFSPDGNTMYFSRESFFEDTFKKDSLPGVKFGLLHIFRATKFNGHWVDVESLNINRNNFSIKNPSVSPDGQFIYFASDTPAGYGQFDIYKSKIKEDGTLGVPINLGEKINTPGQEMFPYVSSDYTLYFSSNGHLGLGALDVFYTRINNGSFTQVRNLGIPVNSVADDFAFRMEESTALGYVSSNRKGGVGSDDIYAIERVQPLCDVNLVAIVKNNENSNLITGASLSIYNQEGQKISTRYTNKNGVARFTLPCNRSMVLEIISLDYNSKKLSLHLKEDEIKTTIKLEPIDTLITEDLVELEPIYFEFDKSNITARAAFELDKLVQIMSKYPKMIIKVNSHTDNRGSENYNLVLSDRRAKTTVQYVISKGIDALRISGKGVGENEPAFDCGASCTEEQHQLNRRSVFRIVK